MLGFIYTVLAVFGKLGYDNWKFGGGYAAIHAENERQEKQKALDAQEIKISRKKFQDLEDKIREEQTAINARQKEIMVGEEKRRFAAKLERVGHRYTVEERLAIGLSKFLEWDPCPKPSYTDEEQKELDETSARVEELKAQSKQVFDEKCKESAEIGLKYGF